MALKSPEFYEGTDRVQEYIGVIDGFIYKPDPAHYECPIKYLDDSNKHLEQAKTLVLMLSDDLSEEFLPESLKHMRHIILANVMIKMGERPLSKVIEEYKRQVNIMRSVGAW